LPQTRLAKTAARELPAAISRQTAREGMVDMIADNGTGQDRRALLGGPGLRLLAARAASVRTAATGLEGLPGPAPSPTLPADAAAYFAREEPCFTELSKEFTLDPDVVCYMATPKGSVPRAVMARYRDGLALAPAPMAHPQRVDACVGNNRARIGDFVAATQDVIRKMG
jgi:hypothetical protein